MMKYLQLGRLHLVNLFIYFTDFIPVHNAEERSSCSDCLPVDSSAEDDPRLWGKRIPKEEIPDEVELPFDEDSPALILTYDSAADWCTEFLNDDLACQLQDDDSVSSFVFGRPDALYSHTETAVTAESASESGEDFCGTSSDVDSVEESSSAKKASSPT